MATIRDIAREAGVSVSTVSLAINGDPRVKAETRAHVLSIAERLRYRATYAARSLSSGKSWIINVINPVQTSALTSGFSSRFLHGVHNVARENRYTVSLTVVEGESEAVDAVDVLAAERASDGAILMNPSESAAVIEELRAHDFAHVMLGRAPTGGVPSVDNNTIMVGADAARHLIEQEFCPIVFLSGPESHTVTQDRLLGFNQAHTDCGLSVDPSLILHSTGSAEDARHAIKSLLEAGRRIGAVLALSDAQAIGALQAVRQHGLKVPDDVAIMGMNNDDLTAYTEPTLSSVEMNAFDLGSKAASLLLAQIEGTESPELLQTVAHELVIRRSTTRQISGIRSSTRAAASQVVPGGEPRSEGIRNPEGDGTGVTHESSERAEGRDR